MQQIIVMGNVGRDPELKYTESGTARVNFSVAVNDRQRGEDVTTWYRVTAWGRLAETCNTYIRKGSQVGVSGSLAASQYEGNDGEMRMSLDIRADSVKFLGSRSGSSDESAPASTPAESEVPW